MKRDKLKQMLLLTCAAVVGVTITKVYYACSADDDWEGTPEYLMTHAPMQTRATSDAMGGESDGTGIQKNKMYACAYWAISTLKGDTVGLNAKVKGCIDKDGGMMTDKVFEITKELLGFNTHLQGSAAVNAITQSVDSLNNINTSMLVYSIGNEHIAIASYIDYRYVHYTDRNGLGKFDMYYPSDIGVMYKK